MKNKLTDLQNHLFEMIEKLNDDTLTGEGLDQEIKRSLAINELAKTAVTNGALMVKAADTLYGIDTDMKLDLELLPLIPGGKANQTFRMSKDKKTLLPIPKGDM